MNAYDDDPDTGPSRVDQLRDAILDSAGLNDLPNPEPLIGGILYRDSLAWLHGKPGNAKSFVALDWAACVSTGITWQGSEVARGPVLYVIAEGVTGLRQRVRAWEANTKTTCAVSFLPTAVQMLSPVDVNAVIILATEIKPALIVLDTQARVTQGADENSAKDMGQLVASVDRIRYASRACVLTVHHESRNGESLRGSTALEGAATTLIRVSKDGSHVRLDNTKQKDAVAFEPIKLRLVPAWESAVLTGSDALGLDDEMTRGETQLLELVRDSAGTDGLPGSELREIALAAKMSRTSFYKALNTLVRRGEMAETGARGRRRYSLAASFESRVPESSQTSPAFSPSPVPSPTTPVGGGTSGTDGRGAETGDGFDGDEPPF